MRLLGRPWWKRRTLGGDYLDDNIKRLKSNDGDYLAEKVTSFKRKARITQPTTTEKNKINLSR